MDSFTSLESFSAHQVDMREDFDVKILQRGEEGDIYKIKINISINPVRQDYFTYIYRWADIFHGFRNYTKDYQAKIRFTLNEKDAEVVLVQPVNEGVNVHELALMQKTSQLAGGASWQGIAAEIDLAERHREQFIQQSKNPILRGIILSKSEFDFTISPRKYVAERTFRIPFFMSRYSIEQGIDSGLQFPVSAYILVKNKALKKLSIRSCGFYQQLGDPHNNDIIPYGDDNTETDDNDEINCEPFKDIRLPEGNIPNPDVPMVVVKPNRIDLSWGTRKIMAGLVCATNNNAATVKLVYIDPKLGEATLKQGGFNGKAIFWIETKKDVSAEHGKNFILEFCTQGASGEWRD